MKIEFMHDHGFYKGDRVFCEVYGIPDEKDDHEELLNQGWLPDTLREIYWFQSRSCRLNCRVINFNAKRRHMLKKLSYKVHDLKKEELEFYKDFYKKYCATKGFDIMHRYDITMLYKNLKVMDIYFNDAIVGFAQFIEYNDALLFVNVAYDTHYPKISIGTNAYYLLMQYTHALNKTYLYIYEAYEDTFSYKLKLPNLEYFNNGWHSFHQK